MKKFKDSIMINSTAKLPVKQQSNIYKTFCHHESNHGIWRIYKDGFQRDKMIKMLCIENTNHIPKFRTHPMDDAQNLSHILH